MYPVISVEFSLSLQVIYYSTDIFEGANLSETAAKYATLGTGVINVLMTLVSALIVDRAGRRTLHLIGLGGMFVFTTVLSLALIFKVIVCIPVCTQHVIRKRAFFLVIHLKWFVNAAHIYQHDKISYNFVVLRKIFCFWNLEFCNVLFLCEV